MTPTSLVSSVIADDIVASLPSSRSYSKEQLGGTSYSGDANDYEVGPVIGFGSSAMVHSAQYRPTGQRVAIKMVDLDLFEGAQIEDLRREIQVMSLCRHDHLLRVLSSFVHESRLWIVTPLIGVGSCLEVLRTLYPKGMPEPVICLILHQALLALDYLHRNGHLHRDVKAGNLLMDEQGTVLLADFGVSATLLDDQRRGIRRGVRKTFVGTPCWMAPEVMEMTAVGYDWHADIWSLGITAMELAMGHAPYARYPPMKVIYLTLSAPEPPLFDRHGQAHPYSRSFKEFIECCLQREPAKRPSAEQLLKHGWFKSLKKRSLLVDLVVSRMPSIYEREDTNNNNKEDTANDQTDDLSDTEWDFDIPNHVGEMRRGRFVLSHTSSVSHSKTVSPIEGESPLEGDHMSAGVSNKNNSANSSEATRRGRFERMPSEDIVDNAAAAAARIQETEEGKRSRFEVTPPIANQSVLTGVGETSQPMSPVENPHSNSRPSRFKVNTTEAESNQATIQSTQANTSKLSEPLPTYHHHHPQYHGRHASLTSNELYPSHWYQLDQMMMMNDMIRQQLVDLKWHLMSNTAAAMPPRPLSTTNPQIESLLREMEQLRLENERLRNQLK